MPLDESKIAFWSEFLNQLPRGELELTLSPAAHEILRTWRYRIEGEMIGKLSSIKDWAGKGQVGHFVRLAGLLHLMHGWAASAPITAEILEAAKQLMSYYESHALFAYESMVKESDPIAENILVWANAKHPEFTLTQYRQSHRDPINKINAAIKHLVDNRLLVEIEIDKQKKRYKYKLASRETVEIKVAPLPPAPPIVKTATTAEPIVYEFGESKTETKTEIGIAEFNEKPEETEPPTIDYKDDLTF